MAKFVGTFEGPDAEGKTMKVQVSIPIDDPDFKDLCTFAQRERPNVQISGFVEGEDVRWRPASLRESLEMVLEEYFDRVDDDIDRTIREIERQTRREQRNQVKLERRTQRRAARGEKE
jgi:hypothetical protein